MRGTADKAPATLRQTGGDLVRSAQLLIVQALICLPYLCVAQGIHVKESGGRSLSVKNATLPSPVEIKSADPKQALEVRLVLKRAQLTSTGYASTGTITAFSKSHQKGSEYRTLCATPCKLSMPSGIYDLHVVSAGDVMLTADGLPVKLLATPRRMIKPESGSFLADVFGMTLAIVGLSAAVVGGAGLAIDPNYDGSENDFHKAAVPMLVSGAAGILVGILMWTFLGYTSAQWSPGSVRALAR